MLAWPDGRVRPLLFDGSPMLPSAVCGQPEHGLLVGGDAVNAAAVYPDRFEPYPKRRIDDGVLLLGPAEVPVLDVIAAVLSRVLDEARRIAGGPPAEVVLTHPVSWATRRRQTLLTAADHAGVTDVRLVAEPVAAAHFFTRILDLGLPVGGHLLVHDIGAGTFDASLVHRHSDGFEVLASQGLPDAGGLDMDAAVMAHFGVVYGGQGARAWHRLMAPVTPSDRRQSRQAWDAVRAARESLSRAPSVTLYLPVVEQEVVLVREQLEELARPVLDRTVAAARTVVLDVGVSPGDLAGVLLVGGASRTPLAATLLHRAFGMAPTVIEQPELVVAEGSLVAAATAGAAGATPLPVAVSGSPAGAPDLVQVRLPAPAYRNLYRRAKRVPRPGGGPG
jgi:molecular chaperone DnaK (HSP70)